MTIPVLEALINARVADIVDPPRSWRKDMKAAFLRLPRDLQLYFAFHEKQREQAIHKALREAAKARKKLKEIEANGDRESAVPCRADHSDSEGMRRDH
ncbi:hypothetical protein H8A95_05120 [Bradyrhizobium sp. Pear76]|uniref:hypothetical protein n=1 Tax=Bradyrhizobium oropedii TaxID=1571201 RepID=UPI001E4FD4B3|nr:hypothetical protein [Bradyrhizobium oropedii]MCC8961716.1 hypothetical protein [Bradyrhizobium oropedii]